MEDRFTRNTAIEVAPMKGETVLFNPGNNKFCVLNATASFIWHSLDRPQTAQEIAVAVVQRFKNVEMTQAQRDVKLALTALRDIECIFAR